MADVTDKRRLRQVQQQDLTESRLNDDFLYWLKTKGLNYLTVVLFAICAYMAYNWWVEKREAGRDAAWAEMSEATLPQAFDEIAKNYGKVDSIAYWAWLKAGDAHMREVVTGLVGGGSQTPGPDGTLPPPQVLDSEGRTIALESADRYYQKILDALSNSKLDVAMLNFKLAALFGRAAVAESRGDIAAAKGFLETVKATADGPYPTYAAEATKRIANLEQIAAAVDLPAKASLPTKPDATPIAPNVGEELIRSTQTPAAPPAPAPPPAQPAPAQPAPAQPAPAQPAPAQPNQGPPPNFGPTPTPPAKP